MLQLIAHLVGDYLLQNDWVAANKKAYNLRGWLACFIHCVLYTLCFAGICDFNQLLIIFSSHFVVDKFGLAEYWVRLINWNLNGNNFGFSADKPKYMSVWLLIITDNIIHIIFNYLIIKYV